MPTTREEIVAEFLTRAAELETSAAATPDSKFQPWVVVSASGSPLRFEFDPKGWVTKVSSTNFENATSLSEINAVHLAAQTTDGNGDGSRAMKRREAMLAQAADLRKGAADLSKG